EIVDLERDGGGILHAAPFPSAVEAKGDALDVELHPPRLLVARGDAEDVLVPPGRPLGVADIEDDAFDRRQTDPGRPGRRILASHAPSSGYFSLNRIVVSPIEISSPSRSSWVAILSPLTKVPLWLCRSSSMYFPAHLRIWQCLREQLPSLGMGMSTWALRPMTVTSLISETTFGGNPGGVQRTKAIAIEITKSTATIKT